MKILSLADVGLEACVQAAVNILSNGGLVAVPTETVYGIAAKADLPEALQCLRQVKSRESNKAFPLQIASKDRLKQWATVDKHSQQIANHFFPGPLTMVLPLSDQVLVDETLLLGTQTHIGIRVPKHDFMTALLSEVNALAVPSANPAGEKAARSAAEVAAYFEQKIALCIDGGILADTQASTVASFDGDDINILREGPITQSDLEAVLC